MKILRCAVQFLSVVSLLFATQVSAENWPQKPINFINAFPAGGSSDVLGRTVSEKLSSVLGQPVVVQNRPGANGQIAGSYVVQAAPDGYTILQPSMGMLAISPTLYSDLPYDVEKDLAPVIQLASLYNLLVVHPDLPVRTVQDLIDLAKKEPGKLSFASAGIGSSQHIAGELFNVMADVKMMHVPYKGGTPALVDMVAGRVPIMFGNLPELLPHVKEGRLRAIAFGSAKSSPLLPDVPTISATIPDFAIPNWYGVSAPAGTPKPIIDKLKKAFQEALDDKAVQDRLVSLGFEVQGGTPEDFAKVIKQDIQRWKPLVEKSKADTK